MHIISVDVFCIAHIVAAQPAAAEEEAPAVEEPAEVEEEPAEEAAYGNPFVGGLDETRRIDLDELKFGRNYNRDI